MALYYIVNMSDPYTIDCPDLEIATIACLLLGNGQYGFEPLSEGAEAVPLMLFGTGEKFSQEKFQKSLDELATKVFGERMDDLATALESVLYGRSVEDRERYEAKLPKDVTPRERLAAAKAYNDHHRSSLNNISGRAFETARAIRSRNQTVPQAPQQIFIR